MKFFSLFLLKEWNKKWLGKVLIVQEPGVNSLLNRSKEGNTSLNLLSISTIRSLIVKFWLEVRVLNNSWWGALVRGDLDSSSNLKIWLWGREWALSCTLLLSFWRCRWMGIRPTMALIPNEGKVQKAPRIQITSLLCIFLWENRIMILCCRTIIENCEGQ